MFTLFQFPISVGRVPTSFGCPTRVLKEERKKKG